MYTYFYCIYRKLADKKLVLGWRKTEETVVLCSRSPKHLFLKTKLKNVLDPWKEGGISIIILCSERKEFVFFMKMVLHVKKQIPETTSIQEIRNKLRNFSCKKVTFSSEIKKMLVVRANKCKTAALPIFIA